MKTIKEWIECNLIKENGSLNERRMGKLSKKDSRTWVEKHHIDRFDVIIKWGNGRSFKECVYMILQNIINIPSCKICDNDVAFIDNKNGYRLYCSTVCMNNDPERIIEIEKTKRSNGSYDQKRKRLEETNIKKYGKPFFVNRKKGKDTLRKNFGVDHPAQSSIVKKKMKDTMVKKWGVENPMYISTFVDKMIQSRGNKITGSIRCRIKRFGDKEIPYQGTYEKIFLESLSNKNIERIKRGNKAVYFIDGKQKTYYPDFVIENTVYEIKSKWTWDNKGKNKRLRVINKLKLRSAKRQGHNVILVLDHKQLTYNEAIRLL